MECYVRRRHEELKVEEGGGEDRLSSLPDAILIDILSRLTTKAAASTSVLSHRWRTLWTNITRICLPDRMRSDSTKTSHILHQLTSPKLVSFRLNLNLFDSSNFPKFCAIKSWFHQVCTRNVEEITVVGEHDLYFHIPPCLFNSHYLVKLTLQCQISRNSKGLMSFQLPKLKELTLNFLQEVPFWLEALISSCSLLERLSLVFDLKHLQQPCSAFTISAPNLRLLKIKKECPLKMPRTRISIDAPQLENLDLYDCTSIYYFCRIPTSFVKGFIHLINDFKETDEHTEDNGGDDYYLQEMSKFYSGLSNLTLIVQNNTNIFPYLHSMNLPMFSNLLFFEASCFNGMVPFLQSFPNLEHLVVSLHSLSMEQRNWLLPYSIPNCLMNKLKIIEISYLLGREDDVTLVAYILKNAMVLKRLHLLVRMDGAYVKTLKDEQEKANAVSKECQFFKSLFKLPRCSSTCELVVTGSHIRASGDALQDGYLTYKMCVGN